MSACYGTFSSTWPPNCCALQCWGGPDWYILHCRLLYTTVAGHKEGQHTSLCEVTEISTCILYSNWRPVLFLLSMCFRVCKKLCMMLCCTNFYKNVFVSSTCLTSVHVVRGLEHRGWHVRGRLVKYLAAVSEWDFKQLNYYSWDMKVDDSQLLSLSERARTEGVRSGTLLKRSGDPRFSNRWHRRFCCVYRNLLFYYESDQSLKPNGVIFLEHCTCLMVPTQDRKVWWIHTYIKLSSLNCNLRHTRAYVFCIKEVEWCILFDTIELLGGV